MVSPQLPNPLKSQAFVMIAISELGLILFVLWIIVFTTLAGETITW